MKTSRVILLLLIGIIGGYFIRMIVDQRDNGADDPKDPPLILEEITRNKAQTFCKIVLDRQTARA